MLQGIIESGQRLRLLIVTLAIATMAYGMWQLPQAQKEILPEFGPVYVEVQTEALGLSATEVEDLITVPLEQNLLNGVAWLDDIHSQSMTGLSSIVLIFEPGTDSLKARQMVAERLTQSFALPNVSKPPVMLQPLSSSSRVIMVGLSSDELSQMQTSVVARWTIRPALMGLPGVANVSIWGHRDLQLQVQVDPQLLRENGVLLEDVIATTGNSLWVSPLTYLEASAPGTGGFIDTPNQRLGVQHLSPIASPEELALVPVEGCASPYSAQAEAGPVRCPTLGDVATIVEQHQPLIGDSVTQQDQDILLVIERFPEASTEEVTASVRAKLEEMQPGLGGIVVDTSMYQRENLIDDAMGNLSQLLAVGVVLAVVVLTLFMFDWRSAVVALVAIPLSLTAAALILYFTNASLNVMMITGLMVALGVIIDDAVVDVENVKRRLREHRAEGGDGPTARVIVGALVQTRRPIVAATVVILIAAIPVLFLGGMFDSFYLGGQSSAFFEPIVVSYALAVVVSLAVSLIVTPTIASIVFTRYQSPREDPPAMRALKGWYSGILRKTAPRFGIAGASAAVLLVIAMVLLPQLEEPDSLIPASQDRDLLVTWNATTGTSLPEMDRIMSRITTELAGVSGVRDVNGHVGRAISSDRVVDVHSGEIWVSLEPSADYDQTVESVENVVDGYPGVDHEVETYIEDRLQEVETASDEAVVVRIYGQDMEQLRSSAEDVQAVVDGVDGVTATRIDLPAQEPQLQVEVDLESAQSYGLTPGEVRRTAATLVTGLEVGSLFEDQKVFDVMVVGVPDMRHSVTTVENLLIDTPDGGQVRMGDVAAVRLVPAIDSVEHEAVSRFVDVVAIVDDRSRSDVAEALDAQLAQVSFPFEYHAEVVGAFEDQESVEQNLIRVSLVVLAIGYLVLQAIFNSWRLATLAFVSLPVALVGSIVVIWLVEDGASLGGILGLLAVLAVAVRNSVVLITRLQQYERETSRVDLNLVMRAAEERLTPIVVTALAATLAYLPFAVMGNRPGLEIVNPMAIVIIGGLVTTVIVNLFILPSLYLRIAPSSGHVPASSGDLAMPSESQPAD
jgi:Cu/Ag efflux pump CusA